MSDFGVGSSYVRRRRGVGGGVVVVGSDLIEEARQIERERTLLEVRKSVEQIRTTKLKSGSSWDTEARTARDFRDDVMAALSGLEVRP